MLQVIGVFGNCRGIVVAVTQNTLRNQLGVDGRVSVRVISKGGAVAQRVARLVVPLVEEEGRIRNDRRIVCPGFGHRIACLGAVNDLEIKIVHAALGIVVFGCAEGGKAEGILICGLVIRVGAGNEVDGVARLDLGHQNAEVRALVSRGASYPYAVCIHGVTAVDRFVGATHQGNAVVQHVKGGGAVCIEIKLVHANDDRARILCCVTDGRVGVVRGYRVIGFVVFNTREEHVFTCPLQHIHTAVIIPAGAVRRQDHTVAFVHFE